MVVLLVSLFVLFGIFCMGRLLSAFILPVTIVATLAYVLYAFGIFGAGPDSSKSHLHAYQRTAGS